MRIAAVLLGAGVGLLAQQWPLGLPGVPNLHRAHKAVASRWGAPYVEVEYYVDPAAATLDHPLTRLRAGQLWCGTRVTILQSISARKRRETLEEQYRLYWPGGYVAGKAPAAQAFLAWANHPLDQQDRLEYVADPGGRLYGRLNGGPWTTFAGPELVKAWLGYTFEGTPKDPEILRGVRTYLRALQKGR